MGVDSPAETRPIWRHLPVTPCRLDASSTRRRSWGRASGRDHGHLEPSFGCVEVGVCAACQRVIAVVALTGEGCGSGSEWLAPGFTALTRSSRPVAARSVAPRSVHPTAAARSALQRLPNAFDGLFNRSMPGHLQTQTPCDVVHPGWVQQVVSPPSSNAMSAASAVQPRRPCLLHSTCAAA